MKTLVFHEDLATVTVYSNGVPITLQGEVDIIVKEPAKKTRTNKLGWQAIIQENVAAVGCEAISSCK